MAYQTLYRKYRPKQFNLIYGQDSIVRTLKNAIKSDKISHAYLFTGPRGTGKTSCAKLFAKSINCLNNNDGDACNKCENCISFNENSNPDIIEIDAASNNGVDEIREIRNKVNLVPSSSKYKVYIIDEVHMLSIGAFNALLKTLEEPPKYVIFILATTEPQKLPNTVISRCQRYDFRSISNSEIIKCLDNIAKKENININENALIEISNNCNGGMRDAIGMLDQAYAYCDKEITELDIEILSGGISNIELLKMFQTLVDYDYQELIKLVKNYDELGKDFVLITKKMLLFLNSGLIAKKIENYNRFTKNEIDFLNANDDSNIYLMINKLNKLIVDLKNYNQKELIFEVGMIQIIDELQKKHTNVPRETLNSNNEKNITNYLENKLQSKIVSVPHETLEDTEQNLNSTNQHNISQNKIIVEKIESLKKIRINNILKNSTKNDLNFILDMWQNISDYLIDEKNKSCAGILLEGKPVAASNEGIIITFKYESLINKIEKQYDISKDILLKLYNNKYKVVYVTEQFWKDIRPSYVEKIRSGKIVYIDENSILSEIKEILKQNSVNDFDELIELEEK